jgi:predicted nucleic acid-binding protein
MITAIDTNVILDVLIPNEAFRFLSAKAMEDSAAEGSLVVCGPAYAELCCNFNSQRECDGFLQENGILVQQLTRQSYFLASRAWWNYRKSGGKRERILPDFMIGAHATMQASRLPSRDGDFYAIRFPKLIVIDPSAGTTPKRPLR